MIKCVCVMSPIACCLKLEALPAATCSFPEAPAYKLPRSLVSGCCNVTLALMCVGHFPKRYLLTSPYMLGYAFCCSMCLQLLVKWPEQLVFSPLVQASNSSLEGATATPSYTNSNADHAADKVLGPVPDLDNDYDSWEYMKRDISATSSRVSRDFVMQPLGSRAKSIRGSLDLEFKEKEPARTRRSKDYGDRGTPTSCASGRSFPALPLDEC